MRQSKNGGIAMTTEWLAIQSFQHIQELLSAVNTLSIHTKLGLAGLSDECRAEAADCARKTLDSFLKELEPMVQEAEDEKLILGADPRRRQFVESFITAKHNRHRFHSALFQDTFSLIRNLLSSNKEEDRRSLLKCLEELRVLLEEHIHADTMQILGGI
jgi:recombinational DNA repair ATPase RecF